MTSATKNVAEILKEIRPEFDFTTSSDFIADGMLDSFDMVTLVSALDKNYGISIPGTDIVPEHFKNIQTIEALLRQTGAQV
jgi:acyl carrier protein